MGEGRREVGTLFSTACMTVPIGRRRVNEILLYSTNRKEGEQVNEILLYRQLCLLPCCVTINCYN